MARVIIALISVVVLTTASTSATTIHVPADQPTIQAGINAASNGDTVLVAPGTYYENVSLGSHDVVLASNHLIEGSGGYVEATVIDGSHTGQVISVNGGQTEACRIIGFTIRNGGGPSFTGNGIYCGSLSAPRIEFNIIEENDGGGILAWVANPTIQHNIIRNNSSNEGGGIYCYGVTSTIGYNLIEGNVAASTGGGIFYYYSSCAVENNTIVDNTCSVGAGVYFAAWAGVPFRNNIIRSNSGDQFRVGVGSPSVTYCNIQGSWTGTGNIDSDPLFINPGGSDFRLQSTSPCINAGDPDPAYNDPDGTRNDMGAYPWTHMPITIRIPADQPTIQAGVNAAWLGDTVLVAPGTYQETVDFLGKNICVKGEFGAENTILTFPSTISSLISFVNGEDTLAILDGFTVRDVTHVGDGEGVIRLQSSSARIRDCRFINNKDIWPAQSGEAVVRQFNGFLIVEDCYFGDNRGIGGAAIAVNGGRGRIQRNVFVNNFSHSNYGGALCIGGVYGHSTFEVENNLFIDNSTGGNIGGAVFLSDNDNTVVRGNTFVRNTANGDGGAIGILYYCVGIVIENNVFVGNSPYAIANNYGSSAILVGNLLDGNLPSDTHSGDLASDACEIVVDPLFCDTANGNYSLYDFSPCAAANNSCGQLIGAYDVACSLSRTLALPDEGDSVHVVSHTPNLAWSWAPNGGLSQTEYEIAVGTDQDWSYAEMWNPAPFVSADTQAVYAGAPLADGATYYARVRSKLNGSWTPWYETSFHMNALPDKPALASPPNGAATEPQPTLFVHNAVDPEFDPLAYQFFLYDTPGDPAPLLVSDHIPEGDDSTGWTVTEYLAEDSIYAWRCRAWDGYEYSDTSNWFFFAVDGLPEAPGTPTLVAPLGENLILYDMLPSFAWTEVIDPDPFDEVRYRLELSLNANFTLAVPFDDLTDTVYQFADSLAFDTRYWWRVKALDGGGLASTSAPSDFWTWTLGDVNRTHDCTIGDVSILIDHLFITNQPIVPAKTGDVNATCDITIGDVSILIDHLFIAGASFLPGCE